MQHRVIATFAAALAALVVAGCGSSDEQIPSGEARALVNELNSLEEEVDAENCEGADATLTDLFTQANELPSGTKGSVRELLDHLENLVNERCREVEETTSTATTSATTVPTTSETTEPTTSETTETTTETTTTPPGPPENPGNGGQPGNGGGGGGTGGTPPAAGGGEAEG